MFSLIIWLVFGWIAGSIAGWLWPEASGNRMQTIGIGIAGSVAGGLVGSILTGNHYAPAGLVLSVLGSLLCMFIWRKINEVPR